MTVKPTFIFLLSILYFVPVNVGSLLAQDEKQAAADKRKVSVLMRLKSINVNEKPALKESVVRFLQTVSNESEYLTYAKRFQITETNEGLWKIANETTDDNNRAKATGLLVAQNDSESLTKQLLQQKEPVKLIDAMGLVANQKTIGILKSMMTSTEVSSPAKNAAAKGLGRQKVGQQFLLELVASKKLPEACEFTVANILLSSADNSIKTSASKFMKLPATAGSQPLAPITELVGRKGNIQNGMVVFAKQGTCANCHKVSGQGKEVGPDLTEIGSKLSRQAMYESILNPSLAVSHNYETYLIETIDGLSFSGVMTSETDDKITIRTAEAVTKEIIKEDIEGMKKSKKSLMPNDLQKNFSESDLVDLVEYLMTLKKK